MLIRFGGVKTFLRPELIFKSDCSREPTASPAPSPQQDKAYGRAALSAGRPETEDLLRRLRAIEENVGGVLDGVDVTPSLLHGDLWIGEGEGE